MKLQCELYLNPYWYIFCNIPAQLRCAAQWSCSVSSTPAAMLLSAWIPTVDLALRSGVSAPSTGNVFVQINAEISLVNGSKNFGVLQDSNVDLFCFLRSQNCFATYILKLGHVTGFVGKSYVISKANRSSTDNLYLGQFKSLLVVFSPIFCVLAVRYLQRNS
jgi:hypothetical protein